MGGRDKGKASLSIERPDTQITWLVILTAFTTVDESSFVATEMKATEHSFSRF